MGRRHDEDPALRALKLIRDKVTGVTPTQVLLDEIRGMADMALALRPVRKRAVSSAPHNVGGN